MKKRVNFLLTVLILIIILPIEYYCMLSIPYADDFSDARGSMAYFNEYGNYLVAGLVRAKDYWLNFHGAYSGMFLVSYLNAFARWGIVGMRIFNAVCMLLFFLTLFFLIGVFCNECKNNITLSIAVFLILIFWLTNNYMYSEVYTWNNVICIYVVPLIFVFLGEGFYIMYIRNQKYGWIPATICAILVGGGSLNVATIGCGMYLFTLYYCICQLKERDRIKTFAPFVTIVLATLFNTVAPGNFVRWGEDEVSIAKVLFTSFLNIPIRIWEASTTTPFIAILIVLFILVHKNIRVNLEGRLSYKHPLGVGTLFVLGCTMVNFSYCLGDRQESIFRKSFEDRAFFVQDVTIYLLIALYVFYFAGYIRRKYPDFEFGKLSYIRAVVLCITSLMLIYGHGGIKKLTTPYMICAIMNRSSHDYSDYQEEIMKMVENGDGVVRIEYDSINHARKDPFICGLGLTDDLSKWNGWHNSALAAYYGKTNVEITYND